MTVQIRQTTNILGKLILELVNNQTWNKCLQHPKNKLLEEAQTRETDGLAQTRETDGLFLQAGICKRGKLIPMTSQHGSRLLTQSSHVQTAVLEVINIWLQWNLFCSNKHMCNNKIIMLIIVMIIRLFQPLITTELNHLTTQILPNAILT